MQKQRGNAPIYIRKRVVATSQHDDTEIQPIPSFIVDQYAKIIAMLNKHELETSSHTPRESTSAAMLAGKIFYSRLILPLNKIL